MKSYARLLVAALVLALPATGALAQTTASYTTNSTATVQLPEPVRAQIRALNANPSDQTARENLVAALQDFIQSQGLEDVEDIARELLAEASQPQVAEVFAESVANAAITVAAATPGADVFAVARSVGNGVASSNQSSTVIQAAARGARSASIATGSDSTQVVSNVTGGAEEVTDSPAPVPDTPPEPAPVEPEPIVENPAIDISE